MSTAELIPPQAESPFLPKTYLQYAWDSTSLGYLKTCPRLYYYHMIEGWQAKDESIHLRFGIEYHAALQGYDLERAEGISHNDAVHDVTRETLIRTADWDPDTDSRAGASKNRDTLIRAIVWRLDHYQHDQTETIIMSNDKPAVEQSFRFQIDDPYVLCGHLDRIVLFNDEIYVMDYKTTTRPLGSWYFDQWEPSNQMTLYTLAGKVVLNATVKGVIIDAVQIKKETSKAEAGMVFARGFTSRTPDQLDEWLTDLRHWLKLAERYAIEGYWPQNDTACDKFGGCRFREVCSKSPAVRDRFLEGGFTKQTEEERWNPLRTR